MAWFGKKEEKKAAPVQAQPRAPQSPSAGGGSVKVLGSGCAKCKALEAATRDALARLNMEDSVEHVSDFAEIAAYGVMTTPALVVDGRVLSHGQVLKTEEVVKLLQKARA